jgi:hypothetical protein
VLTTFSGRRASQDENELQGFIDLLQLHQVTRYLEIGARHGDTFHSVMTSLPEGSYGLAIDLPGGMWGKATTASSLQAAAADLRAKGYIIDVILGDSTSAEVVTSAKLKAPYGAALIDGDHRYRGVKQDWINYGSMAPLIAFHDIVGVGESERVHGNPVEVPRLWDEIKAECEGCIEFVSPGSRMGIGVVCNLPL